MAARAAARGARLVRALVGARAAQPDLVLAEVRRDVGDDLAHGQALAGPEVARQPARARRLQHRAQLLRQLARQACGAPE